MIKIDSWAMFVQMLGVLVKLWPLWLILLCLVAIRVIFDRLGYEFDDWIIRRKFRQGEKWRSGREMISWLRQMPSEDFERYVADIFRRLGYRTDVVGGPHDGGVDVVAEKNGIKCYIQCKRYSSKNEVGVAAVRDFYGSLADRMANGKGYMVTTGKFTLDAEKFVEDKPMELVDSHRLLDYIRLANGEAHIPTVSAVAVMKCPRCGNDLVERTGKFGKFLGCSNYPKCKFTKNLP